MFDRLSHVYQSLLWASFVLFVTTALSASFGVAAYSVSLGVLAMLSFGSVFAWRAWRLLGVERLGLALLIWLCAREVLESGTGGLLTVLSEYRLFWVAPLIAVALNRWVEPQNILVPVVVALGIYFIGSVSLTLLDDPFLISEQKRVIQGNGGPHLSLGGKFVNGLISTLGIGLALGASVTTSSKIGAAFLVMFAAAISAYTLFVEDGRTGYALVVAAWLVAAMIALYRSGLSFALVLLVLVIGSTFVWNDHRVQSQVERVWTGFDEVLTHKNMNSSTGQRLQGFVLIADHDWSRLMFGDGYTQGREVIEQWSSEGRLIGEPIKSGNLHSDVAHILLYGGVIGLTLYGAFGIALLRLLTKSIGYRNYVGASLSASLGMMIFVSGCLNSTLLDLRERAVVIVLFVLLAHHFRTREVANEAY